MKAIIEGRTGRPVEVERYRVSQITEPSGERKAVWHFKTLYGERVSIEVTEAEIQAELDRIQGRGFRYPTSLHDAVYGHWGPTDEAD